MPTLSPQNQVNMTDNSLLINFLTSLLFIKF